MQGMDEVNNTSELQSQALRKFSRRLSIVDESIKLFQYGLINIKEFAVTEEDYSWLAQEIYNKDCTNLQAYESLILSVLIETMVNNKANQRSLDDCANIFIYYLKVFKLL